MLVAKDLCRLFVQHVLEDVSCKLTQGQAVVHVEGFAPFTDFPLLILIICRVELLSSMQLF